jgi:hypothetical protein
MFHEQVNLIVFKELSGHLVDAFIRTLVRADMRGFVPRPPDHKWIGLSPTAS